jgi:POT family proton-dependent oligopeptide transporter
MLAPGGTWFGYPKGVFLLSFTELWERFSYYGMLALLVLFLTASVERHGFGWERTSALHLYGFYTGLIFCAPLAGGWIANSYWGERRCILLGGVLLVLGHASLGGPALIPWLAERASGVDVRGVWEHAGVSLGSLFPGVATERALRDASVAAGLAPTTTLFVYRAVAIAFLGGLLLIALGTALLKPAISSIVGRFFADGDARREAAFSLFFVGIYLGGLAATFVVGFLGERVAWHWGFTAAGVGMSLGLTAYLCKQSAYLADIGRAPVRAGHGARRAFTPTERDRIKLIVLQGLFTVAYAAAFYQKGGLLTLFASEHLDRTVDGWQIPATWFLTVSTVTFVLVTPFTGRLWTALAKRDRNPSAPVKLAWGLLAIGLGYVVIATVTARTLDGAFWGWLVVTYVCFGIGDALVWPIQIATVSRLAPAELSAVFVGGWYLTIGLGSWLTGYIGAFGYRWGMHEVFVLLAAGTLLLGATLWLASPRLRPLAHGQL